MKPTAAFGVRSLPGALGLPNRIALRTQLIDALIESCRAGNEAPALNRNGELETMLNLGLKAIDTPFTEPFCALGTSKCSYTTISRSPDSAPYPKTLVGYSCIVG